MLTLDFVLNFGTKLYHKNVEVENNRMLSIWHRVPSKQDLKKTPEI